jgi:hypothetical protein
MNPFRIGQGSHKFVRMMTGAANAGTYPGCRRILLEFFVWEVVVNFEIFFRKIGAFDLEEPQKKNYGIDR